MLSNIPSERPSLEEIRASLIKEEIDASITIQRRHFGQFVTENNLLIVTDTVNGSKAYMSVYFKGEWEQGLLPAFLFFSDREILVFYQGENKSRYSIDCKVFRALIKDDMISELWNPIKSGFMIKFYTQHDQEIF